MRFSVTGKAPPLRGSGICTKGKSVGGKGELLPPTKSLRDLTPSQGGSYLLAAMLALLIFLSPCSAKAVTSNWALSTHVKARLVSEGDKLGVEMETDPGWHTYYKDPGDAGIPTTFNWNGSRDFTVKEVVFPPPQEIDEYNIKTKAYEGNIFFPVKAQLGAKPHAELKIEGAICKEICMAYSMNLTADLPASSTEDLSGSYWFIIGTALLAGLILNFMPCVLPVLSLKIMGVLRQSGVEKERVRYNFAAASFGIIFSFWILAIVAILFRNAGRAAGWGLHFQSPIFVGVLFVITFIFSISLFGFFHLRPPSWIAGSGENNTILGNFFSGVLATLLGTSCTAPLVVTAVGFALSRSQLDIFLIFTVMGVGMAMPFIIFAFAPQIAMYLPKPGGWMIRVKYLMGVLLLATSIWLGLIVYGQLTSNPKQFEEEKIAQYVAEGKTVFVDVTATWCLNCKVNKAAVIDTKETQSLFAEHHVVVMVGDMTRPSKVLIDYIKKYNRYGIPFNMVYGPNAKDGILLPTLLSKRAVREAVEKAESAK